MSRHLIKASKRNMMKLRFDGVKMEQFIKIYSDTNKLVYSFIYKYTNDPEVVHEISSMVWLKVINNLDKFLKMEPQHLKNYLKVMVRTTYADFYKTQKREEKKLKDIELIVGTTIDELNFVEDELFFVDNRSYLRKAIDGLKEEEIELLTLKFDNNLKWKEIAGIYNVSEGSIRTRQSRIYAKLRQQIEQMVENDEVVEDEYK